MQGVFQNHQTIVEVNKTFITLIPQKEDVSFMKDFRLINLCNVVYKVIIRLLSLRIRSYMTHLIGPCQSSFVPDRHSGDNIIVAQEDKLEKGRTSWMAIKLDLEKAYDRLNWKFI